MNFNKLIILLFIFLLFLLACDKKESSINCECQKLPILDFSISQGLGFNEERMYFESDTFIMGSIIKVEVINENLRYNSQYKWKIGTDPTIRTGKMVELEYDVVGEISITLISEWTPNTDCFPNDIGTDTITKKFHLISSVWDTKVFGEYEGYYESEPDSLVTIYVEPNSSGGNVFNIPIGCFEEDIHISWTYRNFQMGSYHAKNPCPIPSGWGTISDNNQVLTMEYEIFDIDLNQRVSRKFIGNRK